MPLEGLKFLAAVRQPKDGCAVIGPGKHQVAVAAEGQTRDKGGVSREGLELLAAGGFPHDRCILRSGDEVLAVAAQSHAQDSAAASLRSLELLAAVRLPKDRGAIVGCRSDEVAVAAQGHTPKLPGM